MKQRLKMKLSRIRALIKELVGLRGGFFVQYDWVATVQPIVLYEAVAEKCRAADFGPILAAVADDGLADDTFMQQSTNHMGTLDALVDYAVVRWARPERIIEIGSGRSTHVLSHAVKRNGRGSITCVDPAPRIDITGLPVDFIRRVTTLEDVGLVSQLQAGDILFIDSSHILQPGTDCDIQLNVMFPALQPGVIVHVHDVHLPFGYPPEWADRNWNESCGLAPWILGGAFEVLLPAYYASREKATELYGALPDYARKGHYAGGAFWLRKR